MAQVIIPGIDRTITIGAATADGGNSGPDDATSGGTYTGTNRSIYTIEIDAVDAVGAAVASGSTTLSKRCKLSSHW